MNNLKVHITGAAGTLGSSFADSIHRFHPGSKLELSDYKAEPLVEVAKRTNTVRSVVGDLFDKNSEAYREIIGLEDDDAMIWNAAINLDEIPDHEKRLELRIKQVDALKARVEHMLQIASVGGETRRKLFVVVCSITAILGEQLEFLRNHAAEENLQYGLMKGEISLYMRIMREFLEKAGITPVVLYPGSFESPFTDAAKALKNAQKLGMKVQNFRGRENLRQERMLKPHEITDAVAKIIIEWQKFRTVPDEYKEWIMLNEPDLHVESRPALTPHQSASIDLAVGQIAEYNHGLRQRFLIPDASALSIPQSSESSDGHEQ